MKVWKSTLVPAALLTFLGTTGCRQQLYMHQDDHMGILSQGLPKDLETNPNYSIRPLSNPDIKTPPTVNDPEQPARLITLQEALMLGLEKGNIGINAATALANLSTGRQFINDDLVSFTGSGISGDDPIKAFALDPATTGANIDGAEAKFDARWVTSMTWQKNDNAILNGFTNFNDGDQATFQSQLIKPLPTGGVAAITFETDYLKQSASAASSLSSTFNPSYRPSVTLNFEQPLLKDYGIDINQLTAAHPSAFSLSNYLSTGGRSEGILVTRVRYDQQKYQFERNVNIMLFDIESAYWSLYAAYFGLYANDQGLRQSFETWRLTKVLVDAGVRAEQDEKQVRARFEQFRANRIIALQATLEAERQLRGLIGMQPNDGYRLVPADAPTQAPYLPDYKEAFNDMTLNRPELNMTRQELKAQQLNLMVQRNSTRPDLRFLGSYNVNGIGNRIDGTTTDGNALGNTADNKFNNWSLGLRLDVPLGFRDAYSSVRVQQLTLARTYLTLESQERKAQLFLQVSYQQLFNQYEQIRAQRAQREALGRQLELLFQRVVLGKDPLLNMLDAQRDFASAIQSEQQAVANYNIAIAGFHYAKGTLMNYDNVTIANGPLPSAGLTPIGELHKKHKNRFDKEAEAPVLGSTPVVAELPATVPPTPAPVPQLDPSAIKSPAVPNINGYVPPQPVPQPQPAPQPQAMSESGRPIITITTTPNDGVAVPPEGALLPEGSKLPNMLQATPTSQPKQ